MRDEKKQLREMTRRVAHDVLAESDAVFEAF